MMVEIDISKNRKAEALKLATRANELLAEISTSMLSLEYLWDEIQCHYYDETLYEAMDDALNVGYPFKDSYEDVVRGVLTWCNAVAEELDKVFEEDDANA